MVNNMSTNEKLREEWRKWLYERMMVESPRYQEKLDLDIDVATYWLKVLESEKERVREEVKRELREKIWAMPIWEMEEDGLEVLPRDRVLSLLHPQEQEKDK